MKKTFLALFFVQLLLFPFFAAAQLTEAEQAFLQKCHDNVNAEKKQLSTVTAKDCVDKLKDEALFNKLTEFSPEATADVLAYNNALLDLKSIVSRNSGLEMVQHLQRVLEKASCPLCTMGLGPKPEATFEWVDKEAKGRLPEVSKAVRTWDALGAVRTKSLSSADYGHNKGEWNDQLLIDRYKTLVNWAQKETDRLVSVYGNRSFWGKLMGRKPDPALIAALREDLTLGARYPYLQKLTDLEASLAKMGEEEGKKEPGAQTAEEKKAKELAAADSKLKEHEAAHHDAAHDAESGHELFDQGSIHVGEAKPPVPGSGTAGTEKAPFVYKPLSPEQIKNLSGRMLTTDDKGNLSGAIADEMRGTKAGDEIIAFYKDPKYKKDGTNTIAFAFEKQPANQFGGYRPSDKSLNLNSELVNRWMKQNEVTPEQLFEGDPSKNPHLQDLAQYLAPTVVHEATHQRQDAWSNANGINYQLRGTTKWAPYQMEMETEAFSMDGSFMAEKLSKRGATYAAKLDPFDKKNTELFIEKGVDGIRLENHKAYTNLESFQGSAAKEFSQASATAKDLQALQAKYKSAPGTMTQEELDRMKLLRESMNSRFKWYSMVSANSAANETKIDGWRKDIRDKMYPSKSMTTDAPPELL